MTRRILIIAAAASVGCQRQQQRPADTLAPARVADIWIRKELRELPPADAVPPIAPASTLRIINTVYEGSGRIQVSLYDLKSSAAALDAAQRWRPSADTVFFYKQNYFAVLKWENADRAAVGAFVRDLEKRLD